MIFLVFVALYGLAHVFIWHALVVGLVLPPSESAILGGMLLGLGLTPFFARRMDRRPFKRIGRALSWVGYTWAGLVLLFTMARLATDLMLGVSFVLVGAPSHVATRALSLILSLSLTGLLAIYAFFERSRIRVETINVPTTKDIGPPRSFA